MGFKIICTGNPDVFGIAKNVREIYPQTKFISRSSGYDLTTDKGMLEFKSLLPKFNIFINHSQISPGVQEKLLLSARKTWTSGHIFTIGSVLEFEQWSWIEPEVTYEKNRLKTLSLQLSEENFKTSYITIGGLKKNDDDNMRLDPIKVAEVIQWILNKDLHIPHIYVDHLSNDLTNEWLSKRPSVHKENISLW